MVQRRFVSVVGSIALATALASCSEAATPEPPAESLTTEATATSPELVSPVSLITDPGSDDFVAESVNTVLNEQGTGSSTWTVSIPEGADQLRFYVACLPEEEFTVRLGGQFYSGPCTQRFLNWGQFPIAGDKPVDVSLDIPTGVDYWLVAIPVTTTGS